MAPTLLIWVVLLLDATNYVYIHIDTQNKTPEERWGTIFGIVIRVSLLGGAVYQLAQLQGGQS